MNTDEAKQIDTDKKLLFSELTYEIRGAVYAVANAYGKGLKEQIYQQAFAEELDKRKLSYEKEKRIPIYSQLTDKPLGVYIPDFVVADSVVVELKATEFTVQKYVEQQLSYLKASKYEVGYLVNFSTPRLFIKRSIYTNNRKPNIRVHP
jgi:GxxExxY protein